MHGVHDGREISRLKTISLDGGRSGRRAPTRCPPARPHGRLLRCAASNLFAGAHGERDVGGGVFEGRRLIDRRFGGIERLGFGVVGLCRTSLAHGVEQVAAVDVYRPSFRGIRNSRIASIQSASESLKLSHVNAEIVLRHGGLQGRKPFGLDKIGRGSGARDPIFRGDGICAFVEKAMDCAGVVGLGGRDGGEEEDRW